MGCMVRQKRGKEDECFLVFPEIINDLQNNKHRKHRDADVIFLFFIFKESEIPPWRFSTHKGASERFSPMDLYYFFSFSFFFLGDVGKYGVSHHIHLYAY